MDCSYCGKRNNGRYRCGRCKKTYYCSAQCQIPHWNNIHKNFCEEYTPAKDDDIYKNNPLHEKHGIGYHPFMNSSNINNEIDGLSNIASKMETLSVSDENDIFNSEAKTFDGGMSGTMLENTIKNLESDIFKRSQASEYNKNKEMVNIYHDSMQSVLLAMKSDIRSKTHLLRTQKPNSKESKAVKKALDDIDDLLFDNLPVIKGKKGIPLKLSDKRNLSSSDKSKNIFDRDNIWNDDLNGDMYVKYAIKEFILDDGSGLKNDTIINSLLQNDFEMQGEGIETNVGDEYISMIETLKNYTSSANNSKSEETTAESENENLFHKISEHIDGDETRNILNDNIRDCIRRQPFGIIMNFFDLMNRGVLGLGFNIASKFISAIKRKVLKLFRTEEDEENEDIIIAREAYKRGLDRIPKRDKLSSGPVLDKHDVISALITISITIIGYFIYKAVSKRYDELFNIQAKIDQMEYIDSETTEIYGRLIKQQEEDKKNAEEFIKNTYGENISSIKGEIDRLEHLDTTTIISIKNDLDFALNTIENKNLDILHRVDKFHSLLEKVSTDIDLKKTKLMSAHIEHGKTISKISEKSLSIAKNYEDELEIQLKNAINSSYNMKEFLKINDLSGNFDLSTQDINNGFKDFRDKAKGVISAEEFTKYSDSVKMLQDGLIDSNVYIINNALDPDSHYYMKNQNSNVENILNKRCGEITSSTLKDWKNDEIDRRNELADQIEICGDVISSNISSSNIKLAFSGKILSSIDGTMVQNYRDKLATAKNKTASLKNTLDQATVERDQISKKIEGLSTVSSNIQEINTSETAKIREQINTANDNIKDIRSKSKDAMETLKKSNELKYNRIIKPTIKYTESLVESNKKYELLLNYSLGLLSLSSSLSMSVAASAASVSSELLFAEKLRVAITSTYADTFGSSLGMSLILESVFNSLGFNHLLKIVDMCNIMHTMTSNVSSPNAGWGSMVTGTLGTVIGGSQIIFSSRLIWSNLSIILPGLDFIFVSGLRAMNNLTLWMLDNLIEWLDLLSEKWGGGWGKIPRYTAHALYYSGKIWNAISGAFGKGYDSIVSFISGGLTFGRKVKTSIKESSISNALRTIRSNINKNVTLPIKESTGINIMSTMKSTIGAIVSISILGLNIYGLYTGQLGLQIIVNLAISIAGRYISVGIGSWFGRWALSMVLCRGSCYLTDVDITRAGKKVSLQEEREEGKRLCREYLKNHAGLTTTLASSIHLIYTGLYYSPYITSSALIYKAFKTQEGEISSTDTISDIVNPGNQDADDLNSILAPAYMNVINNSDYYNMDIDEDSMLSRISELMDFEEDEISKSQYINDTPSSLLGKRTSMNGDNNGSNIISPPSKKQRILPPQEVFDIITPQKERPDNKRRAKYFETCKFDRKNNPSILNYNPFISTEIVSIRAYARASRLPDDDEYKNSYKHFAITMDIYANMFLSNPK